MYRSKDNYSAISEHRIQFSNFKLVKSCNKFDIRTLESLHILRETKPKLQPPDVLSVF